MRDSLPDTSGCSLPTVVIPVLRLMTQIPAPIDTGLIT
jgi:hypothetical protein